MATMPAKVQTNKTINRKLSTAVGLLCFAAFVMQGLGSTWGFEAVSQQLTQTALLVAGGINIYFLGSTTQKNVEEEKKNEKES